MTIEDKNIIWLDLFEFLTYQKKVKILGMFDRGEDIRKSFLTNRNLREILTTQEINKMSAMLDEEKLDFEIEKFSRDGIEMITIYNYRYPKLLKEIPSPPLCLYCKGNIQLLDSVGIGIVGTRKPTDYGLVVAKQYAKAFANNNITVISGLAMGIDTVAHKTTIDEGGNTIAVLAGGLYHIYPATNISLARSIAENNLILSENSPNISPLSYLFPIRNRIIAGLSKGVVLIEAGEISGSIHTANYALDFNREVFAVPGKINSKASSGTNMLIKENRAWMTIEPADVFEELGISIQEKTKNPQIQLDINQQIVLDYISTEKKTFQQIADFSKINVRELNALLLDMELSGLVLKLANNSYIKA